MTRPVVALVTGFTRHDLLCLESFARLCRLMEAGAIGRILYVTWDKPEIDAFVAPAERTAGIEVMRIPEPQPDCEAFRKGFVYQQRALVAGLDAIADPETLVVRSRPDFLFDEGFLAEKVLAFDLACRTEDFTSATGVRMPPSPFGRKIWVPWADAGQPFFMEDAAFIGRKADVALLVSDEAARLASTCGDVQSAWMMHAARFAVPFLSGYPIFERYLREFHLFVQNENFRLKAIETLAGDPFWWHLIVAGAHVLATSFHVDCGYDGQLHFYPTCYAEKGIGKDVSELEDYPPYNRIEDWRAGEMPGGVSPGAMRGFSRLVDDTWQQALFCGKALRDITPENMRIVLTNLANFRASPAAELESAFYGKLADLRRRLWPDAA